jgi:hypothetical protein
VPPWVQYLPYSSDVPDSSDDAIANGVCRLLQETQVDLTGPECAWHSRTAQRVLTRAGAERVAQFVAEFDPAYERLDVHFIRVLRGSETIDHATSGAIHTFRRETNLERLVLNGRLTASLVIPDVRVDDVVEIGITVYGANPVLGGRYASWASFDAFNPFLETRHRLCRPVTHEMPTKGFNDPPKGETVVRDAVEETVWCIVGQQRLLAEELTPPWTIQVPCIQYSEFLSWNEVARLFAAFYDDAALPNALIAEIDALAAKHRDPAERAVEWLRFVQNRLRYFALSLGEGGLVPRRVETIWNSRLGDCKDAAQLYMAGARRLGLDVCAALVSTTHGFVLNDILPSPGVFNHCIVRLQLNGKSYWLDPTIQEQAGDLDHIFQAHSGWALPLTPETTQLVKLDNDEVIHCLDLEDRIAVGPKPTSPAKLSRRIDHFSWMADKARASIANEGATDYGKAMLKDVQLDWPDASEVAPVEIRDDRKTNCLTTIFSYEIADCWKQADKYLAFEITDMMMPAELQPVSGAQRRTDIYLGRPRKVTRRVLMEMPRKWFGDGWLQEQEMPGATYSNRLTIESRTVRNDKEFVVSAWSAPASAASAYSDLTASLRANLLKIWARERYKKIRPPSGGGVGIIRIIWMIIVGMMILAWLTKHFSSLPR